MSSVAIQCVILAGGLGTRMRPLTEKLPKTLLPVHGKPFAHYQLSWMARRGVTDVVYCLGDKGHMVRDFVRDGSRWGLRVRYVEDGPVLVGTGGALRRALDEQALADWFLVHYGDSFLPIDLSAVAAGFRGQRRPALMVVYRNQGRFDAGNVQYADGVVRLYQKNPAGDHGAFPYIDYGVSVLSRSVVAERIPPGEPYDLAVLAHALSRGGHLAGMEAAERFYEIGSPAGLSDFEHWLAGHPEASWTAP
jgi:NDP-sugar pyrophosphorylase family protein